MRKMMCILLVLSMLCWAALAEDAPGNRIGIEALNRMTDGTHNQFVSPISLAYALAMAAQGAEGETREQLLAALDIRSPEEVAEMNAALLTSGLRWANAVFLGDDLNLLDGYGQSIRELFSAEVFPLDSPQRVNDWAAEHTDGLIDSLVDDLDPSIRLMLLNAVAMDAQWLLPFEEGASWEDTFYTPSGETRPVFMHQRLSARYAERSGTQFIRLDYLGGGLAMMVALPPEGQIGSALNDFCARGLDYFEFGEEAQEVILSLPKVDVTVTNSLSEPLKELGLVRAFAPDAELDGITGSALMVSDILQKVRVQVDEEGTRAAAVTEIAMVDGAAPFEEEPVVPVVMNVNHPYILVIADEATGAVCFAGVVVDPAR